MRSPEKIKQIVESWSALRYGMFIHYGMSTFVRAEMPDGREPSETYAPTDLNVDSWIQTAAEAGMKYAVLTAKHVSGHCLWNSRHTDYSVATSADPTDVVAAFTGACKKHGVLPGLYYCSWDNHHRFGSKTPNTENCSWHDCFTTPRYWDFQMSQLEELCTGYGPLCEIWIDIPKILPRAIRQEMYDSIARWQPDAVIVMNHGISDGSRFDINYAWPTDVIAIERFLPSSSEGFVPLREIEGTQYYLGGEVCDPIGREWFFVDGDTPRSDEELLGMYLLSTARGCNLLLDVPPDRNGRIPVSFQESLLRLKANLDRLGL